MNAHEFANALGTPRTTGTLDLYTADGLTITIRRNYSDAMTVAEIFLDHCYGRGLTLASNPVVIDVGGFIGDFTLYAVKHLNASRVIVCEPSPRNWALLLRNISQNGYGERIDAVNKAVTADGRTIMMNIDAPDECQNMISGYLNDDQPLSSVPGISLGQLFRDHAVETVDLLKLDVEGGEYSILENTRSDLFSRIRNIVFEYHDIDGGWGKLKGVKEQLRREGFVLHTRRGLVTASRP